MVFQFLLIFLFLVIMAFFSAAETAFTSISKPKLHHMAKSGDKKARIVLELQEKLGLLIGVLLTCATFSSCLVASVATQCISNFGNTFLDTTAPLIIGCFILIYAEVLPKMLALQDPTQFSRVCAPVINRIFRILLPFNIVIQALARMMLKILGITSKELKDGDKDELRGAIDMHESNDEDSIQEKAMLKSILDLDSVQVKEIMVHRQNVMMIDLSDPIEKAIDNILASPFTRIPLWKDNPDNILGVLHTKSLLRALKKTPHNEIDLLSIAHQPWFIPENADLLEQLRAFRARHEHFSVVVDEYGSFMGIVTLEDILEEIVGDISDEHDVPVGGIRLQDDGSYIIMGRVTIRDLNRNLGLDISDDDGASTVAGLLIYHFRMIPNIGQIFHYNGLLFEVLRKQNNQITLIRLRMLEKKSEDNANV